MIIMLLEAGGEHVYVGIGGVAHNAKYNCCII